VTALADGGFALTWIAVSDQTGPDVFTQKFEEAIVGGAGADRLAGTPDDDFIHGQAGPDRLEGFAGNDKLDGGEGRDRMIGGTGDDRYFVDHPRDQVVEREGEGQDVVYSSISWRLDKHVENLVLMGSGDLDGFGNELDNILAGSDGANRLAGGKGSDVIDGRGGPDTIVFDSKLGDVDQLLHFVAADDVIELDRHVFSTLDAGALDPGAFAFGAAAVDGHTRIIYQPETGALIYDPDGSGAEIAVHIAIFVQLVGVLAADNFIVV
jgi:Ca2+-binding RTX toxin-like protein